jgi:hypothetical protein
MALLIMTLLLIALLIIALLITDFTCKILYLYQEIKKHICNAAFINIISKVIIGKIITSKVFISIVMVSIVYNLL